MFIRRNNKNKGFTLIEVITALVIGLGIFAWVMNSIVGPNQGKKRVVDAGADVTAIVNGSIDWVSGNAAGYTDLTLQKLVDDKYINITGMTSDGTGTPVNPWGGSYTAGPDTDVYTLKVTVTSVPDEACDRLADKSPQATCSSGTVTYIIEAT